MLRAALTPAAHMERPYWKIHMSQLRRNTRAASRTRDEARDESECVSSLIFQLMSPDEGNKRWCRSAGEDENVSECLFAPSSDCQAGRPHRLQTHRRRLLLITEPAVNLSLSVRTTWFIPQQESGENLIFAGTIFMLNLKQTGHEQGSLKYSVIEDIYWWIEDEMEWAD